MNWLKTHLVWVMLGGVIILFLLNLCMVFIVADPNVQKTVDIHPPKTGISVHFSD